MVDNVSLHLREEVPEDIVLSANLDKTVHQLYDTFASWREKNAELLNTFLDQSYFKGEESLINKFIEIKPDIKFSDIEDEWINLATLAFENLNYSFQDVLDNTTDEIKQSIINNIHRKITDKLNLLVPGFTGFPPVPVTAPDNINVIWYFQKVVDYLNSQQSTWHHKTIEILEDLKITNFDINDNLVAPQKILGTTLLSDDSILPEVKQSFDRLLSFEIGKEADRTTKIVNNITEKLWWLFSNSFPAINTIISESSEYKYDERKLGPDFEPRKLAINNDKNLTSLEKKEKINDLKRELYIEYLKTENPKIGNALEQLYKNDFDYSKLDANVLKDYIDKVVDLRIKKLYDSWMNTVIKINYVDMNEFSKFYKELANVDPARPIDSIIHLTNVNLTSTRTHDYFDIPIHKSIVKWKNLRLKDIEQYSWSAKAYDSIPFRYEINKTDIDNLDVNLEDRTKLLNFLSRFNTENDKYVIDWKDVWMLIYLFFVVNNRTSITTFDPDKQKKIQDLFWKVKQSERRELLNDAEKFKKKMEDMGTWVPFENWAELWMPVWDSDLPWWWYQWMRVKISDVDMKKWTFKWRAFGWELKFWDKLEWKSHTFDMNDKTIERFKETSKDPTKIRLLPNPSKSDFESFRKSLKNKLWTSNLEFPIKWTTWNWKKFMQTITKDWKKDDVEVNYFATKWDNKSVYKIEYNPIRNCFKVSSAFIWKEKGKNWKTEDKRFHYSRDMDWNNFLIFFTQKWLTPQTDEEAGNIMNKNEQEFRVLNGGHRKLNWFSINNVKNAFKALKWNIKKKIDDYNKKQDETLEDILIWDHWFYRKLANVLWFIPSMKEWLWELEQEYYNERDNRTWKKIEYYLKLFQADPDFWTTFDQVPPHAKIQWWRALQKIVLDRVKNATDRIWDPGIYQAAALLLANFEKGWSAYRGLASEENSWLWVKALLWKKHFEQFMKDKDKLIKARDNAEISGSWDKKGFNETLAACEMKYIINNIRWSYKWLIVWSYEERWIQWDKDTVYIDNPSKRLLSDQFASKLDSAYGKRFNKSTVDETYRNKFQSNNSFDEMENEFGKCGSTRYQIWEAALRRMIDLATTDDLRRRMKKHFLTYLLSWALDVNCDPWLKKQIYGWAKPMMFVPWLLVKEAGVAENIAVLLDDATFGDFSKNVTKYFHRSKQLDGSPNFKWLQEELNDWLTDGKIDYLDNYFSKLPTKDFSRYPEPKRSILTKFQKAMSDSKRDEWDRWILDNAKVVSNWLLSSVEVVEKRIKIQNWKFNGKDIDEDNNMADFRKEVSKDICRMRSDNSREVAFVLEKFINRFGIDSQQLYTWIKTADYWDNKRGYFSWPYESVDLNMWNIWDKEIDSILRYAFLWNARRSRWLWCERLPDELYNALDTFRNFLSQAFKNWTLLNPYVIKNGFKPKDENIKPLFIGSRQVYDQVFAWGLDSQYFVENTDTPDDDLYSTDKEKQGKAIEKTRRALFKSSDFINYDIANIEKKLRSNLTSTSTQFMTVTSSRLDSARNKFFDNNTVRVDFRRNWLSSGSMAA